MATATEIANLALAHCRIANLLSDVWQDETANAQALRLHLPSAAYLVAMAFPWPFLITETALVKTVTQPESGAYYAIPHGAFAVHRVLVGNPTPTVRYQRDLDLKKPIPEPLRAVLALALAVRITPPIAKDNNLAMQLSEAYQAALSEARGFYARQNHTDRSWWGSAEEMNFSQMSLEDGTEVLYVPVQRDHAVFDDYADTYAGGATW